MNSWKHLLVHCFWSRIFFLFSKWWNRSGVVFFFITKRFLSLDGCIYDVFCMEDGSLWGAFLADEVVIPGSPVFSGTVGSFRKVVKKVVAIRKKKKFFGFGKHQCCFGVHYRFFIPIELVQTLSVISSSLEMFNGNVVKGIFPFCYDSPLARF